MEQKTVIKNCYLVSDLSRSVRTDIFFEEGKITDILPTKMVSDYKKCKIIDGQEKVVIPGLIDIHIQGAGGCDVLDNSDEALTTISRTLAETGTTSYLATTVVKPESNNEHLRLANKYYNKKVAGAELIGIHLEGPFINEIKIGGLNPTGVYNPSMHGGLNSILEATGPSLKMMTIAPELEGHEDVIRALRSNGIIAAFAHSNADYNQTKEGFKKGINHVTHLYNAMRPITHREPGPLPAIFEHPTITAQMISDGHHIHPRMVKFAYDQLGLERCICVTDGMHAIGLPEGTYQYNGRDFVSKDGAAKYLDGTLIGSTMSLLKIAGNFSIFTGCSFADAIDTVTKNPAKLLGIEDRKGVIKVGADADLVILNDNLSVYSTIVAGKTV